MSTLFVDHLTVIDCSYLDAERGVVGESWIVDLQLTGGLDEQSMVLDFGLVKKTIKQLIDDEVDHKLLVPSRSSALTVTGEVQPTLQFDSARGLIEHRSPADALCLLPVADISPAAVTDYLHEKILQAVPSNVERAEITLYSEAIDGAYYHYSHGLKKHDGNCQRIAHGHRSRIEIYRNSERQPELEYDIANQWQDIYLGSEEDLVWQQDGRMHFAYTAPQGSFSITLPVSHCDVLNRDSTVECIAEYLAEKLSQRTGQAIRVKAFEGVRKGAIGFR